MTRSHLVSTAPAAEPITVPFEILEQNPHSVYRLMRPLAPLVKREDGVYVAIRAADVDALAADPRTRQLETEIAQARGVTDGALHDVFKHTMLLSNGMDHRNRRQPLSHAFAFNIVTDLRPRIRAIAQGLIDRSRARGEMDFITDYASWIPARVISDVLGIPEDDIPDFTKHVYNLARSFGSSFTREMVPELQIAADTLIRYAGKLLQKRRAQPRNDFLTSYIISVDEAGRLSYIETLVQIVTVLLAGSDTTRAAIAIQTSLLLQHREQWNALCQDAALVPGAVLESLRYEPSVGSFSRFTLEDIWIDGMLLPRNRVVSLSTLAAMRDPAVYAEPDTFNIKRSDQLRRHPVFGAGVHRCLGAALAKAELEESLTALASSLPQIRLMGEPPAISGSGGIRTVKDMRVCWPA